jgi:hypothetical protein
VTKRATSTIPTLRDLALDHIHAIAADLRKAEPSLTRERAVAKAAATPAGREAHAIYNRPGSHLPWPQAVAQLDQVAKAAKQPRKVTGPSKAPADDIYAEMCRQAVAAAPAGTSKPRAIADFLATREGEAMHARWSAARRAQDE